MYYSDKMLDINRSDDDGSISRNERNSSNRSSLDSDRDAEKGFARFVQLQHGMPKLLKSLIDSDVSCIVRFFPSLMTQLLKLLVTTTSDDVSKNVVRVIIHVLQSMHEVHKEDIALSFVEVI